MGQSNRSNKCTFSSQSIIGYNNKTSVCPIDKIFSLIERLSICLTTLSIKLSSFSWKISPRLLLFLILHHPFFYDCFVAHSSYCSVTILYKKYMNQILRALTSGCITIVTNQQQALNVQRPQRIFLPFLCWFLYMGFALH